MPYLPYDITILAPEIILMVGGLLALLYGVFAKEMSARHMGYLVITIFGIAAFFLYKIAYLEKTTFNNSFETNFFVTLGKCLVIIAVVCNILLSVGSQYAKTLPFEVFIIMIFATCGMLFMISANDLLVLYLSLELMSLSLYILIAYARQDIKASEAALKYFILGALASGFYLFGSSMIYGFAGSINFDVIGEYYVSIASSGSNSETAVPLGFLVGIILVLVTFCFKISAAPFHMWTPDVYQGAPTIITSFLATAPKVAAIFIFTKLLYQPLIDLADEWRQIIIFAAIASIMIGGLGALRQQNIKRMLAYSTIGHIGFILLGLSFADSVGVHSALTYLIIYLIMTIVMFALLLNLQTSSGEYKVNIQQLAGLNQESPYLSLAIAVIMFSMAGIPPLAGFFAKFYILLTLVRQEMYVLAVLAVIFVTISCFYYLRIIKVIYFDAQNLVNKVSESFAIKALISIGVVFNLSYALWPEVFYVAVERAVLVLWGQ